MGTPRGRPLAFVIPVLRRAQTPSLLLLSCQHMYWKLDCTHFRDNAEMKRKLPENSIYIKGINHYDYIHAQAVTRTMQYDHVEAHYHLFIQLHTCPADISYQRMTHPICPDKHRNWCGEIEFQNVSCTAFAWHLSSPGRHLRSLLDGKWLWIALFGSQVVTYFGQFLK